MNPTRTSTLALAGVALVALAGCSSSSSSSSSASSTTATTPSASASPTGASSSTPAALRPAGGYTDASLTQILKESGAAPAAGIAPVASIAADRTQQLSQMQAVKKAIFTPATCGEDFLAYMDGIGGAGARAQATTSAPQATLAVAAQPDVAAAKQLVAHFDALASSCPTMTMGYMGQSQAVNFAKAAPRAVDMADEVALGSLSQGSGATVQRRRIELARVGNVVIQVTTQPGGAAAGEKAMAALVKAVAEHPAK